MEQFVQSIEKTFSSGDPEIRSWFLVRNNYLPFLLCGVYVVICTVLGPAIMRNKKPYELRKPMIVFNFTIVAAYVVLVIICAWTFPKISRDEFCKKFVIVKGDPAFTLAGAFWVMYMLKYMEMMDTVFFVLRKKENSITFLHVFHHTIVPILGWILFRTETGAIQSIPVLLNAFVHIIMYSYYGLAAMGPRVRKYLWWKKHLTQLQIIQFFLMIVFVAVIAPLSGCSMVHTSYLMDIFLAPLFLYLFYRFYTTTFQQKNNTLNEVTNNTLNGKYNGVANNTLNGESNGVAKKEMFTNGNSRRELETEKMSKKEE